MLNSSLVKAVLDQAVLSCGSLVMSLLVARAESREGFGVFALGYSVLLMSNAFLMALLVKPFITLASPADPEEARERVRVYLSVQLALSGLLGLFLISVAVLAMPDPASGTFVALGAAIPAVHCLEVLRRAQLARQAVGRALAYDALFVGTQVIGLAAWLAVDRLTARTALAQLCVSALVAAAVALAQMRVARPARMAAIRIEVRRAWGFVRWSGLVTLVDTIEARAYPFMAAAVVGLSGPAVLEAARLILSPTNVLLFPVLNLLMPLAAQMYGRAEWLRLRRVTRHAFACVAGGVGLYAGAVFWAATPIVMLTYGGRYADGGPVVRLFCVYYALACLSGVASVCLESMQRPRAVFVAQVATVAVGLGVGWIGLGVWGAGGAVAGMIAGAAVGVATKTTLLWRHLADRSGSVVGATVVAPSA